MLKFASVKTNNMTEVKKGRVEFPRCSFEVYADKFLRQVEIDDKLKEPWMTKNHVANLHESLNEFYLWLEQNVWNRKNDDSSNVKIEKDELD